MAKKKIEMVCDELDVIWEDLRTLKYAVGRYNSDIDVSFDDRTPMPKLINKLGTMVSQLNSLRVDLTNIREAKQLEES